MEQVSQFSYRFFWTIKQAAHHYHAPISVLKHRLQSGRFAAFNPIGGYYRIELEGLQLFLRQYGVPFAPISDSYICILIIYVLAALEVSQCQGCAGTAREA